MKIKKGFMLREVANNYIVVPVGTASLEFKGLINLNSVGAFIWKCLETETTIEEIIERVVTEYKIDENLAKNDVLVFVSKLKEAALIA